MDPARRQRILRQHLRTEQLLGLDQAPKASRPPEMDAGAEPAAPPTPNAAPANPSPTPARPGAHPSRHAEPAAPPAPPMPTPAPMSRDERIAALEKMNQQEVVGCTKCGLCQGRTQTVFGEGDPEAPIMFIGEGPGGDEDAQGRPFVGRSGKLLTDMIHAMGYDRQALYIANVVKCRPPNNRTPTAVEVQTCWDYLRRQIEIIRPGAMVTLGGPATKRVLEVTTGITKIRGTWHQYQGIEPPIPVMPTFHPSFVLRAYTRENRGKVWSDLQQVLERATANGA